MQSIGQIYLCGEMNTCGSNCDDVVIRARVEGLVVELRVLLRYIQTWDGILVHVSLRGTVEAKSRIFILGKGGDPCMFLVKRNGWMKSDHIHAHALARMCTHPWHIVDVRVIVTNHQKHGHVCQLVDSSHGHFDGPHFSDSTCEISAESEEYVGTSNPVFLTF